MLPRENIPNWWDIELLVFTLDARRIFFLLEREELQEMREHAANEDRLQLLGDVTGKFRPGVLTALIGVIDAGKTTLVDVFAGRKTGGYIEALIQSSTFPKKHRPEGPVSSNL
ncbi:hypothetical protein SUGI_0922110 [Cryptomeria japonica]|nr:hypothetical protein SUGI_0922110 [Cryptomeria japonica]